MDFPVPVKFKCKIIIDGSIAANGNPLYCTEISTIGIKEKRVQYL